MGHYRQRSAGSSDRVRLRFADDTLGSRHYRDNRLAAETEPSVGVLKGLKRRRSGMSPDEVCGEKKRKGMEMAGFVKKRCLGLMEALIDHPYGEVFRDISILSSIPTHGPEYLKRLTKRMDLSTIKNRLDKGDYSAIDGFIGDVRLVFSNALTFFPVEHDVHSMADRMSKDFETELKKAVSEIKMNQGENIFEGAEKFSLHQGFNNSSKDESPIKSPKTVLQSSGATAPRTALLKERFKETILKAETAVHRSGREKKRNREREAAREALKKMEQSVKFGEIEDHKALKELEHLCGYPLSDSLGTKILSRLGLLLKDEAFEPD